MKDFGSKIGTFVVNGAKVAGAAILGFTIKGAKDVADFDNKMQEVFTLMPGITDDAMSSMKASMRSLADTMGIDLLDSVNASFRCICRLRIWTFWNWRRNNTYACPDVWF